MTDKPHLSMNAAKAFYKMVDYARTHYHTQQSARIGLAGVASDVFDGMFTKRSPEIIELISNDIIEQVGDNGGYLTTTWFLTAYGMHCVSGGKLKMLYAPRRC